MRGFMLVGALVLAVGFVVGCGGSDDTGGASVQGATSDTGEMQHIHGLGVVGDTLYIATHEGLWTAAPGATSVRRFGESRQDIMGFSVVGERRFIGSGHPAPDDTSQPPNLGLIASGDAGRSWRSVSLLGEVDFHVLQSKGQQIYGIDSGTGALLASRDGGRRWQQRTPPAGVFSLAIDPRDPGAIVASTEQGVFRSANGGEGWRPVNQQLAGLLAWPTPEALYLVDGQGAVHRSRDGGQRWESVGEIGGQPAAFIAHDADLYVALADNRVQRSSDGGRTWSVRAQP